MGWPRGRNAGSTTTSQASHARGAKKEKENRGRANRLSFPGALARRRFEPTSDKKPSDGHSGSQTRLAGWGHAPVAFRPWGRLGGPSVGTVWSDAPPRSGAGMQQAGTQTTQV